MSFAPGAAPHLAPAFSPAPGTDRASEPLDDRLWAPKRVVIARSVADPDIAVRAAKVGAAFGAEIVHLKADALRGFNGEDSREVYRRAKSTLAIVRAPPSALKLQPIPPSADFRVDFAVGCPAHCQYCYLAGSLTGPPLTRAYANLDEVLDALPSYFGTGHVTSIDPARAREGTTFEASCYTDPLAIEHLTGSLEAAIVRFAQWRRDGAEVGLRFTTKYAAIGPLLGLAHEGATRIRFSVNADAVARRFEGGTAPVSQRLAAMAQAAQAHYPVGLTIAPIMPIAGWREAYGALLSDAAAVLPAGADVTVELITHRFTPASRNTLLSWYPATSLEMDPSVRTQKRTKFGSVKYVYPKIIMREMRTFFEDRIAQALPGARLLYWT